MLRKDFIKQKINDVDLLSSNFLPAVIATITILQIVESTAVINNNSSTLILRDQCVSRNELELVVQSIIREKVQDIVYNQTQALQTQIQTLRSELIAEMRRIARSESENVVSDVQRPRVLSSMLPIRSFQNPADSCSAIGQSSPSGDYWIINRDNKQTRATLQYCDMTSYIDFAAE